MVNCNAAKHRNNLKRFLKGDYFPDGNCFDVGNAMESVNDLSDDIFGSLFELACSGKWKQWSDTQPVGTVFDVSEEMLRNTGDEYIDLLWELLDKIEEVKGQIRVNPRVKPDEDATDVEFDD